MWRNSSNIYLKLIKEIISALMKSEEEWMIQWTNVNQNLIDAIVFFKWKWGFLYQIDLDSRGKLLALSLWTELTEMYEE